MALLTRKYIHRLRPVPVNALRLWMSVALWLAAERRLPTFVTDSHAFIAYCAIAAAFGPFVSRTALMYALRYVPASTTVLVGLTMPVITLVVAFAVFGTLPDSRELLGGAIMLGGIAIPLLELRSRTAVQRAVAG
jgi:drug/metabolite transporter (DMT)-like permease